MDPYDYSNPPPAYNDQEFDRKTSLATEASLQQAPLPPAEELSEERWAEIEEAAFQAAIAASLAEAEAKGVQTPSEGQSSRPIEPGPPSPSRSRSPATVRRLATIKPLRIEKKGKTSVDLRDEKDKPKWLAEAEGQASSSSSQAEPSAAGHSRHDSYDAPPPFVAVAPEGNCAGPPSAASSGTSPGFSPDSLIPTFDALSLSSLSSPASDHLSTAHPHQPPVNPLPQPPTHAQRAISSIPDTVEWTSPIYAYQSNAGTDRPSARATETATDGADDAFQSFDSLWKDTIRASADSDSSSKHGGATARDSLPGKCFLQRSRICPSNTPNLSALRGKRSTIRSLESLFLVQ
ncbi:hypothetical protein FA13DRAFT_1788327 [Coprinellus micaceus]|uniref:Uncharacterized protein n=1 Tax=Coprinellus micaceus TaxID=71717 RepID=A0A4Y7TNI7_COPMI|nr:hypothetical protein FA13DRAFT_1788327 [Coprinellus micaceus]